MLGLGPAEVLIIGAIALLLFAPTLLAFWLGFTLGRKTGDESGRPVESPEPVRAAESPEPVRAAESPETETTEEVHDG